MPAANSYPRSGNAIYNGIQALVVRNMGKKVYIHDIRLDLKITVSRICR